MIKAYEVVNIPGAFYPVAVFKTLYQAENFVRKNGGLIEEHDYCHCYFEE